VTSRAGFGRLVTCQSAAHDVRQVVGEPSNARLEPRASSTRRFASDMSHYCPNSSHGMIKAAILTYRRAAIAANLSYKSFSA
jgi:hypothetical protein